MRARRELKGISFDRFPAVEGRELAGFPPERYGSAAQYAHALSFARIIKSALREGRESVLILEDDIRLSEGIFDKIEEIEIPADWEIFYLGCSHFLPHAPAGKGVVRVAMAYDTHAVAFRRRVYGPILRVLRNTYSFGPAQTDVRISFLHPHRPCYAASPNLAWQANGTSDIQALDYARYGDNGEQLF